MSELTGQASVCSIRVVVHGTQIMVSLRSQFFKLSLKIYTFTCFVYPKFHANHLFAVHVMSDQ